MSERPTVLPPFLTTNDWPVGAARVRLVTSSVIAKAHLGRYDAMSAPV
ncbi:MAG: hypothetical protein AAFV19_21425 [Pseudomonadota bacterium]